MTTKCAACATPIEHYPSQLRKYCSRQCRAGNYTGLDRSCVSCGQSYTPASARQLNCAGCSPTKGARARLRRYGVTAGQWEEFRDRYNGACWLCRDRPATCLDHDHTTKKPRGALCRTCNMALHYLENKTWSEAARAYLEWG